METANQLFAEKGYANTGASEITKKAGASEGTIFRHYQSKENLLISVLLTFSKESLDYMAEEVFKKLWSQGSPSLEQFLMALVKKTGINFLLKIRTYFRYLLKSFFYNDKIGKEIMPHFTGTVISRIEYEISRFQERGEIIDQPVK